MRIRTRPWDLREPAGLIGSPGPGPQCAQRRHFTAGDWTLTLLCLRVPSCFSASFDIRRPSPGVSLPTHHPPFLSRKVNRQLCPVRSDLKLMTQRAVRLSNAPGSERDTRVSHGWSYSTHTDNPRRAPMHGMRDILTRTQANAPSEASPARRGRSSAAAACPVADVWSSTPIANTTTMFRSPTPRTTRLSIS